MGANSAKRPSGWPRPWERLCRGAPGSDEDSGSGCNSDDPEHGGSGSDESHAYETSSDASNATLAAKPKQRPAGALRGCQTICVGVTAGVVVSILMLAVPCWTRGHGHVLRFRSHAPRELVILEFCVNLVTVALTTCVTVMMYLARTWSSHLHTASNCAAASWAQEVLGGLILRAICLGWSRVSCVLWIGKGAVYVVSTVLTHRMTVEKVRALEESMCERIGARELLRPLRLYTFGVTSLLLLICGSGMAALYDGDSADIFLEQRSTLSVFWSSGNRWGLAFLAMQLFIALPVAASAGLYFDFLAVYQLVEPLRRVNFSVNKLGGSIGRDVSWAFNAERLQVVSTISHMSARYFCPTLLLLWLIVDQMWPWFYIVWALDSALNAFYVLLVSGFFDAQTAGQEGAAEQLRLQRKKLRQDSGAENQDPRWNAKAEELAGRGFTLAKLLDFYEELPREYMPHYDSHLHTTDDVVREAIIPMTKDAGVAYATIMMDGVYTPPTRMITHNWSNCFRDLISAIVADALDESEFCVISCLLDSNLPYLKSLLDEQMLGITYWVCAFSVAQHNGICASVRPGACDPVTGQSHVVCDCGLPKFFSDTSPLDGEGRSIPCEMNKFTDMLCLLANRNEHFRQVMAVDESFDMFRRAWCVAETAESFKLGLEQQMKIKSRAHLDEHKDRMRALRIEDMQASRPEDIRDILARIPDKSAFNEHLQAMIFDPDFGLITQWSSLDSTQQMTRIGRTARWLTASTSMLVE